MSGKEILEEIKKWNNQRKRNIKYEDLVNIIN